MSKLATYLCGTALQFFITNGPKSTRSLLKVIIIILLSVTHNQMSILIDERQIMIWFDWDLCLLCNIWSVCLTPRFGYSGDAFMLLQWPPPVLLCVDSCVFLSLQRSRLWNLGMCKPEVESKFWKLHLRLPFATILNTRIPVEVCNPCYNILFVLFNYFY